MILPKRIAFYLIVQRQAVVQEESYPLLFLCPSFDLIAFSPYCLNTAHMAFDLFDLFHHFSCSQHACSQYPSKSGVTNMPHLRW